MRHPGVPQDRKTVLCEMAQIEKNGCGCVWAVPWFTQAREAICFCNFLVVTVLIDLLMGLCAGAVFHGRVPGNSPCALMGRFPCLMALFLTLVGPSVFPLENPLENSPPSDTKLLLTKIYSEINIFEKLRISRVISGKSLSFPEI